MAIAAPSPRHADALGHATGDELLQAFARRIQSASARRIDATKRPRYG
jgi:GGDEF domain-containing protein